MTNNPFVKSAGQTAADLARKIARQVVSEPLEVIKNVKSVASAESVHSPQNPDVQVANTPESISEKIDEEKIRADDLSRLSGLEAEIRQLIQRREQMTEEWKKNVEAQMKSGKPQEQDKKTLIQPTSKRKSGFAGAVKGKQGTKEISKSPSG